MLRARSAGPLPPKHHSIPVGLCQTHLRLTPSTTALPASRRQTISLQVTVRAPFVHDPMQSTLM